MVTQSMLHAPSLPLVAMQCDAVDMTAFAAGEGLGSQVITITSSSEESKPISEIQSSFNNDSVVPAAQAFAAPATGAYTRGWLFTGGSVTRALKMGLVLPVFMFTGLPTIHVGDAEEELDKKKAQEANNAAIQLGAGRTWSIWSPISSTIAVMNFSEGARLLYSGGETAIPFAIESFKKARKFYEIAGLKKGIAQSSAMLARALMSQRVNPHMWAEDVMNQMQSLLKTTLRLVTKNLRPLL